MAGLTKKKKTTTKDAQIWVRVSPALKRWAEKQAEAEGRSLSGWIARQLEAMRRGD